MSSWAVSITSRARLAIFATAPTGSNELRLQLGECLLLVVLMRALRQRNNIAYRRHQGKE